MVSNKRKNGLIILALAFALGTSTLLAEQVEVTADNFFADEVKQVSVLTGNVHVKKGAYDTLDSNKLTIYFDKNRQPTKYVASDNARFKILINNSHYNGKGDTLTYEPLAQTYLLSGNAYINEVETKREVFGDKITINQLSGKYEVQSFKDEKNKEKKPAKLIFQIEDKK
ncbi:LptA/OstA family protein [Campylobacter geochelonis]|uniref:Cell envelope biogenesis protein YhbN n=1 Tax=Campylobacter geochelonis TaxID=1780362 RepID=A0A128EK18_9BACT|nr:LptA/OstA family protein [Campylobacter geochelonis]QKF71675.1 lipooligosaccharide transport system, periplasmic component LptA [Campylobacter geochelonis]CZE49246.1 cell envelope biogenesis protein YhbN [Campylobacter geochelonis]CZE49259.1 cell envelope biogenesis protein YhbN [Campylobacter geochelonis]CZE51293.1 cell envelope biogenesis protein YhbN [Campylobacter geochelonis]